MENGFIKIYRKLLNSRVFSNEGLLKVWIWCLLKANHKPQWVPVSTGTGVTEIFVNRGQFIFGRKSASKELGMPESTIRNRIEKLKKLQNLATFSATQYTLITIDNYDTYQSLEKKEDSQKDSQRTTRGQPEDTNNNDKNDKNIINVPKTDPRYKLFTEWFSRGYEAYMGKTYHITDWKKHSGVLKNLFAKSLTFEELQYLTIEFLDDSDPWVVSTGKNPEIMLREINRYSKYLTTSFQELHKDNIVSDPRCT